MLSINNNSSNSSNSSLFLNQELAPTPSITKIGQLAAEVFQETISVQQTPMTLPVKPIETESSSLSSSTKKRKREGEGEEVSSGLLNLPRVLITKILSILSHKELASVSLVCKRLVTDDVWKEKLWQEEHPKMASKRFQELGKTVKERTWKAAYMHFIQKLKSTNANNRIMVFHPSMIDRRGYGYLNKLNWCWSCVRYIYNNADYFDELVQNFLAKGYNLENQSHQTSFFDNPTIYQNLLIMTDGSFENGRQKEGSGVIEFDGRISDGDFDMITIIELNGREIRGLFYEGRLIAGNIDHLFPYFNATVSQKLLASLDPDLDPDFYCTPNPSIHPKNPGVEKKPNSDMVAIETDDGRILEGPFPPKILENNQNLGALWGAVLRALERQYENIAFPDSEKRILKGHIVNGELFGEGRIIEEDGREYIGFFKKSQLKLGIICNASSVELVGEDLPDSYLETFSPMPAPALFDQPSNSLKTFSRIRKREEEKEGHQNIKKAKKEQSRNDSSQAFVSSSSSFKKKINRFWNFNKNDFFDGEYDGEIDQRSVKGSFTQGRLEGYGEVILADYCDNPRGALVGTFKKGRLDKGVICLLNTHNDYPSPFSIPIKDGRVDFYHYKKLQEMCPLNQIKWLKELKQNDIHGYLKELYTSFYNADDLIHQQESDNQRK